MKRILFVLVSFTLISCSELLHVMNEVAQVQEVVVTDLDIANGLKAALNKGVEKEAKKISVDTSKEEKEYCEIEDKKIFLFYS